MGPAGRQRRASEIGMSAFQIRIKPHDGVVYVKGIQKHGVSWKGEYKDEGVFAGPRERERERAERKIRI